MMHACLQCNTPLEVGETVFTVVCPNCGQWHLVDRSEAEAVLRLYEEPAVVEPVSQAAGVVEPTAEPPAPPGLTSAQVDELEAMDRNWEAARERFKVVEWTGERGEPTAFAGVLLMGIGLLVGGGAVSAAGNDLATIGVGLLLGAAGVVGGFLRIQWASTFDAARSAHERRRRIAAMPRPPVESSRRL
ncbi:MAG: hypothetical protein ACRC1K_14085 [Planctomycetia bacterium]